jgi:hypothetical protein
LNDTLVWDQQSLIQKDASTIREGKEAKAEYRTVERVRTSLARGQPGHGKRNQIRIQARLRGHTLVGDGGKCTVQNDLRTIEFPRGRCTPPGSRCAIRRRDFTGSSRRSGRSDELSGNCGRQPRSGS